MAHSETLNNSGNDQRTYNTANVLKGNLCKLEDGFEVRNHVYDLLSLRILLRSLFLQCGVMQEMVKVFGEWFARCGKPEQKTRSFRSMEDLK